MLTAFADDFARFAGSATARQLALGDVLGDRPWQVDIGKGTATFRELSFPIQLLGTEAAGDNTWLWAWANEASSLPETILRSSRQLREVGASRGPAILATRSLPLDRVSGHQIAMVCTGLLGTGPYYRGPYDGGALYFTIEKIQLPVVDGARVSAVLMQVIGAFEVDHRIAARSFLADVGFALTESENRLEGADRLGTVVQVDFDPIGRLSDLRVTLNGQRIAPA